MNYAKPFSDNIYGYASLFGNANRIGIELIALQKLDKNSRGQLELSNSIGP